MSSGGGMPELGSKISLISKADIRYEGRLYTVDPQECTIALSNVRSFGTEDRETQFQIAPQSQIYDYILFRGSDIKDIRVVNNNLPHPNDPAIMQVHLPNGQHLMPQFPIPHINAPHGAAINASGFGQPFGNLGNLNAIGNNQGGSGGSGSGGGGNGNVPSLPPTGSSGSTGSAFILTNQQQQQQAIQQMQQKTHQQKQDKIMTVFEHLRTESRSRTPSSHASRKSSPEMQHSKYRQQQTRQQNNNIAPIGGGGGVGAGAIGGGINKAHNPGHKRSVYQHQNMQQHPHQHQQYQQQHRGPNNHQQQQHQQQQQQRRNNNGGNQMYDYGLRMDMNNYHRNNQFMNQRGGGNNGMNRSFRMYRDGPQNNQMMNMRNRGGGGGLGRLRMSNQGYGPPGGGMAVGGPLGNQNKSRNNKNTIKFEQDFDFEQANNKFEELRSQLSKLKVGEEPKTSEQVNGETDKKDDSGNETGAGEHEHEDEEITVGYDKTKSFFDNISCEAAQDRTKSKKNDWRQERKLNSETFGVSSTRRDMNFRGRRVFGRGPNMNYNNGGGYNNRGYMNNRGNNNNRNNNRGNNNNRHMGAGGGSTAGQNNENANESNALNGNNNTNDDAGNLKTQQSQPAVGTPNSSATKTKTLENNQAPQPTAVGAGQ